MKSINKNTFSNSYKIAIKLLLLFIVPVAFGAGCSGLQQLAQLKNVKFELDRISQVDLAGLDLSTRQSVRDLNAVELLRLTRAYATKQIPLSFTLHVSALNPAESPIQARLAQMDWALFIQNRQAVTGLFDKVVLMPPGERVDIPIQSSGTPTPSWW